MKSLSRRVKITLLVVPTVLISGFLFDYEHGDWRIEREKRKLSDMQLPQYSAYLKPGMTRSAVEGELTKRSIAFEPHMIPLPAQTTLFG
jgi:hypothetical protein